VLPDQVVYLDLDRNGSRDDGEPTATTDPSGQYAFENLRPDQYVVRLVVQEGWEQTHPGAGGATAFTYTGSDATLFTPGIASFPGVAPSHLAGRADVNGDGWVSALDALVIVNTLNAQDFGGSMRSQQASDLRDVNGDGLITPLDALVVINVINQADGAPVPVSLAEGAAAGQAQPAQQLIGLDVLRTDPRYADLDGRGLSVVVIDTGLDLDHPFFGPDADGDGVADRVVFQYDFADRSAHADDPSGHGSHVTSIIASQDSTYPGVAPGVDIIHLKVFRDSGQGSFSYLEQALQWVLRNVDTYQIAAVNLSLGDGQNWSQPVGLYGIADELDALDALGVITVSAAGNSYAVFDGQGRSGLSGSRSALVVHRRRLGQRPWLAGLRCVWYGLHDRCRSDHQFLAASRGLAGRAGAWGLDHSGQRDRRGGDDARDQHGGAVRHRSGRAGSAAGADQHGQRLTTAEFRHLLRSSGAAVVDGDDEDNSVRNTGHTFFRLDLPALADAVWNFEPGSGGTPGDGGGPGGGDDGEIGLLDGSFAYTIELAPGQHRDDIDFGTRPVDLVGPEVVDVVDVAPDPRQTAVPTVTVVLSKEIDLSTFDDSDLTLTLNGHKCRWTGV
jgi:hypothetical protein